MKTSRSALVRKTGVPENVHEVDKELGGGELSLSMCPGVGNCLFQCAWGWEIVSFYVPGGGELSLSMCPGGGE